MKLQQLNAAGNLRDLSIPSSNQLEALKGDRKGEYSMRIRLDSVVTLPTDDRAFGVPRCC